MIKKLRARLAEILGEESALRDEAKLLAEAEALDEAQEARFAVLTGDESPIDALVKERATVEGQIASYERLAKLAEKPENRIEGSQPDAPQYMKRVETDVDVRTAGRTEVRDAALKVLENEHRNGQIPLSDASAEHIEKMFTRRSIVDGEVIFDGDAIARRMLITETPAYRSAFQKAMKGSFPAWTPEESQAMQRAAEQSLTSASGGYAVPVIIDPTIILTSGGNAAPVVQIARVENITNNAWKGISTAGVAWQNLAENTAATAVQATLAQPSITAHKIAAFVPFSLEIEGDWPNFASDMANLIATGYNDYLAEKTITGTGTIEMWGIFTAIDQTAGSEVTPTTDGALGPEDVLKVWNGLGDRYRDNASWLSSVSVMSRFRNAGTNNSFFTVDLTAGGIVQLNGRPYYTSAYAAAFSGTTGPSNLAIVGDFRNYVIAQRVGMQLEVIPHVVDSNGVPKGQRGYFAWARVGADSVNDDAFRLLQNQ
jgi:HK97 family phage major capsid protein